MEFNYHILDTLYKICGKRIMITSCFVCLTLNVCIHVCIAVGSLFFSTAVYLVFFTQEGLLLLHQISAVSLHLEMSDTKDIPFLDFSDVHFPKCLMPKEEKIFNILPQEQRFYQKKRKQTQKTGLILLEPFFFLFCRLIIIL